MNLRRADHDDARRIAEVHVRCWQAAYRGILPDSVLDRLAVSEREQMWRSILDDRNNHLTLVAERSSSELTGFCSMATPSRDPEGGEATAEIGALYVDPDHWREGVGGALLIAVLAELREGNRREAILWVLPENRVALAFYKRFGFGVEPGIEKREEQSGHRVIRLRAELDEPIRLVSYDPSWPQRFLTERDALQEAIGSWATGGIHHVGSTAVPRLEAKPVIDILVGVESLAVSKACFDPLAKLSYLYAPYRAAEMHWFCKPHPSRRTHHLHLVPVGSQQYRDELAFRDRLRSDPQVAGRYASLKRELAERHRDDREAYTEAKSDFVRAILSSEARPGS
jgi:GrpB-like predicted nucleotidyltransferase (UPF0157 family)